VVGAAGSQGAPGALHPPSRGHRRRRLESGPGPARASRPARRVVSRRGPPGQGESSVVAEKGQLAGGPRDCATGARAAPWREGGGGPRSGLLGTHLTLTQAGEGPRGVVGRAARHWTAEWPVGDFGPGGCWAVRVRLCSTMLGRVGIQVLGVLGYRIRLWWAMLGPECGGC
jgi:hypothetical protein